MSEEDPNVIDDQYQLVMCIASGSSSQVWEVVEKTSARHMAMKLLKKDVPEFKENKVTLKRESEILKQFDHPLIVKFERYSSNRDHTYFLMEHFRASNLKLQIKADTNKVQLKVRQLFEGICSALSHVHQKGFVHRDIKPDNILMNKVGEVRLCDFSLSSKQVTGLGKMMAGKLKSIQGTRTYIAPETIRRLQPTFQTDLYSLGILFYEVLTCKTPFQAPSPEELLQKHLRTPAPNPSEFNPNVSPEMDRIIAKMLKKKPAERPASVDEVLGELKRIRIFKEDIVDAVAHKKANEDNDALAMLSEIRLDSRADAKLKTMLETNPEFAEKFLAEKALKAKNKKAANDRQIERIKVAEDAQAAKTKSTAKTAPAAAAPPPQPMQMPMPMPGFQPGFPAYPQGFAPYPQAPMPMMPMPGMAPPMPGVPQYAPQPQMAYQPPPPQPLPPPQAVAPVAVAPPQRPQPQPPAPAQQKALEPPARRSALPSPQSPPQSVTRPSAPSTAANPAQRPAAPATPARAIPSPATRPMPKPAPPPSVAGDLDFMTDLPDVL